MNRFFTLLALALPFAGCATRYTTPIDRSHEPKYLTNRDSSGLALDGYDPVSYFDGGKPTKGDAKLRSKHQGAWYQFTSVAHQKAFEATPEKYAPAFGGWCGYAVSIDRLSPIDPMLFQILDGRLVLQHNEKAWKLWNEDVAANLKKADSNWPGLVTKNATPERVLVNVDATGVALEGRDPVSYFSGKPVAGVSEFEAIYNGAKYRFASKENRVAFESNPAQYAPLYGGFCGYAASIDKVSPVNVDLYQLVDGHLVLQHTDEAFRLFNEDVVGNYARANTNWPGLVERQGS
jgi:YHS domain-containing protein